MSCNTENVKLEPMEVYIGKDQAQVQKVTCLADTAADPLNSTYFLLYAADGTKYYAWYNVASGGVDPAPSGYTEIEIAIAALDSASTVAAATQAAVDATSDFSATVAGAVVTITDVTLGAALFARDSQAAETGFAFEVVTVGDSSEKIGLLDGDIEVSGLSRNPIDITAHQNGTTVLGQLLTGSGNPELAMNLKEVIYAKYEKVLRYSGGAFLPIGGSNVIGGGSFGQFRPQHQTRVVLHPVALGLADKSRDYCFWNCSLDLDSISFSGENILTLPVTVKAFEDCDKAKNVSVWCYGDWTQNLDL